ncbi:MAG: HTH domain-containing protein [Prevotella sp.]|nr:HTH domain-containing protein [Prevotella sp.]
MVDDHLIFLVTIPIHDGSKESSEKISEKFNVTERTVENDLAKLKKFGILAREGGRKEGKWVIEYGRSHLCCAHIFCHSCKYRIDEGYW